MNQQREVIYKRRGHALEGDRLKGEILDLLEEYVGEVVDKYFDEVQVDNLKEEIRHNLLVEFPLEATEFETLGNQGIKDRIIKEAKTFYNKKEEMLSPDLMARLERFATLSVIDHKWKEHLREMDDLKEGIGLRAYGQKDPLVEYKTEAFQLFLNLLQEIRDEVVSFAFKFFPQAPEEVQDKRRRQPARMTASKQSTDNIGLSVPQAQRGSEQVAGKPQPVQAEEKIGRNDPCPCGSGKKYKHCHGR
jgi:preprotein translocase subunit SecA